MALLGLEKAPFCAIFLTLLAEYHLEIRHAPIDIRGVNRDTH
jgi:hypothetical protein